MPGEITINIDLLYYERKRKMEFNFKNPKLDLVFKYFEEISKIPRGSGNEKEIKKRYSFTRCADEIFLQTLAYNSSFCKNVTGYGQHYIDWSRHGSSPPIIDEGYYEILKNSNKMFARKFSYERYPKIVEQVLNELVKTKSGADKAAIR